MQRISDDPIATWLTPEGKSAAGEVKPSADASFDPKSMVPEVGAPTKPEHFVSELPIEITAADLKRGQTLYNANCGVCHGAAGHGNGKIPERGFLRPPSYHTDPAGKEMDWSTLGETSTGLPAGYSRGFYRWGIKIPLKEVPIGYITQVIVWGYGGMASHDVQLPDWADRWRVAAYVRALQLSQSVQVDQLPEDVKSKLGKPVELNVRATSAVSKAAAGPEGKKSDH
jgi:hypothetical protein